MSYINTTISTNTDEKTFIKKFVEELTAFQGITAVVPSGYANFNAYIDAQFAASSGVPTFSLKLYDLELEFKRNTDLTSTTKGYWLNADLTPTPIFDISQSYLYYNSIAVRSIKVCVAAKDNITALYLGPFDSVLTFSAVGISLSSTNSACAVSTTSTPRAINSAFTDRNGNAITKIDRCNYLYNASNATIIEVIKSKAFVTANSSSHAFTTTGLWDVSTVPAEATINIDTKQYYALDAHTIMEV